MPMLAQLLAGDVTGAAHLTLKSGLTELPREVFDLADTLEVLDISGNALSALPDDFARLTKLRVLFASYNQFTELPEVLGQCQNLSQIGFRGNLIRTIPAKSLPRNLRWLTLTDNQIEGLPDAIGDCAHLQKLMLAGNRLRTLPPAIANCQRLELIRIAANQLTELPPHLLILPRLSWLAFAGNPFNAALEAEALSDHHTPLLNWADIELQQVLGEGASGLIHQARWHGQDVAVKLFKGAVTSDGLPHCEMGACVRAGAHPNLIPVVGRIADHPEGRHALVMALIDAGFSNLAGPPSLESCTRDIYADEVCFTPDEATRIARGIASVGRHLHAAGTMHGDLYAHNILHDGAGQAVLGDFGAASLYATPNAVLAERLQRIEVRAFGCLLEELCARTTPSEVMIRLKDACLNEDIAARPLFVEIAASL